MSFKQLCGILIILSIFSCEIHALTIHCNYEIRNWQFPEFKHIYTCKAIVNYDDNYFLDIKSITGTHLIGKSNENVKSFFVDNQQHVNRFPRQLYKYFPNLEVIKFGNTGLIEITSDDFYGLPNVNTFDFYVNKIESIGNDVFKHQRDKVRAISFWKNPKLTYIGIDVFKNMPNLKWVYFDETPCAIDDGKNHNIVNNQELSLKVALIAVSKCQPSQAMMEDKMIQMIECKQQQQQQQQQQQHHILT